MTTRRPVGLKLSLPYGGRIRQHQAAPQHRREPLPGGGRSGEAGPHGAGAGHSGRGGKPQGEGLSALARSAFHQRVGPGPAPYRGRALSVYLLDTTVLIGYLRGTEDVAPGTASAARRRPYAGHQRCELGRGGARPTSPGGVSAAKPLPIAALPRHRPRGRSSGRSLSGRLVPGVDGRSTLPTPVLPAPPGVTAPSW